MTDYSPIVRLGRLVGASSSDRLSIGGLVNTAGDLTFEDASNPVPVTLSQVLAGSAGLTEPPGPGIRIGGELSVASGTEVGIEAGEATLIQRIAGGGAVEHQTSWAAQDITSTRLAQAGSFWIVTDPGFTGTATIVERALPTTAHDEAQLGVSVHRGGAVTSTLSAPQVYRDAVKLLRDVLQGDEGVRLRSGSIVEVAATLTSARVGVELLGEGLNWHADEDEAHVLGVADASPLTFDTIQPDGSTIAVAQTAYPLQWNNGGTPTALTGDSAAVHQVAVFPGGYTVVQLGTTEYASFADAAGSMGLEAKSNPLWDVARYLGAHVAFVVVKAGATQWADNVARIFPSVGLAGGASGVSTFDELLDTPSTKSGQVGKTLAVNAAGDALEYVDRAGTYVWVSRYNENTGVGVSRFGKQHITSPKWVPSTIRITVETSPTTAALQVDIKSGGVSIVDGALPSIAIAGTTATANLLTTALDEGDDLTVETISTDVSWESLTIEAKGFPRTA